VLSLRDGLTRKILRKFGSEPLVGPTLTRLLDFLQERLPKETDRQSLFNSIRNLAGTTLEPGSLRMLCHRLAGNLHNLRPYKTVLPWRVQACPEWVPVQILSARRSRSARGRIGWSFAMKVMAGTPCPTVLRKFWSDKMCFFLAQNFGFSRHRYGRIARYPYLNGRQLVNMRFYAFIEPELCGDEPGFKHVDFAQGVSTWNTDLIVMRARIDDGVTCPQSYPPTHSCHSCPYGYRECPAGTHPQTYVEKLCPGCLEEAAPFDVDIPGNLCVNCQEKTLFKRRS